MTMHAVFLRLLWTALIIFAVTFMVGLAGESMGKSDMLKYKINLQIVASSFVLVIECIIGLIWT